MDLHGIFMNSGIIREKGAFDEIFVGLTTQSAQAVGMIHSPHSHYCNCGVVIGTNNKTFLYNR